MEPILKQVSFARRRLWIERFLQRWGRALFVALFVAAIAVALPKLIVFESLPQHWTLWCVGIALVVSLATALAWMLWRPQSILDSAVEIDRRFELRERVASSLALDSVHAATPAGQALLRDAGRAVERLEIRERFRIDWGRRPWLPLIPTALLAMLVFVVDNKQAQSKSSGPSDQLSKKQLEESTKILRQRLVQKKKDAATQGLEEAEAVIRELEKKAEQLASIKNLDRKQALVKLNDLAKDLEERRKKLGGDEELRKQLSGMKGQNEGPAEKMVEAMKQGDWNTARKELEKLQQDLAAGKMDDATKQQLQKQLEKLQEKLEQATAARQQAKEDLERQINEQKKKGDLAEAGRLQQKLDQMNKQKSSSQQLEKMAQQMSQCQQALQQGDQKAAAHAMQQMAQQMEQMQQEMAESDLLEAAVDQIEMAKNSMACKECEGEGCSECQGNGEGSKGGSKFGNKPGNGMGAGRGYGPRPDEKNDVRFRDSQVKQNPGRGAAVVVGEAHGPNIRGQAMESIKDELEAAASAPPDPLVIEQLPKSRRQHAEDYFNQVLEGRP